jgi:hypothetical protein
MGRPRTGDTAMIKTKVALFVAAMLATTSAAMARTPVPTAPYGTPAQQEQCVDGSTRGEPVRPTRYSRILSGSRILGVGGLHRVRHPGGTLHDQVLPPICSRAWGTGAVVRYRRQRMGMLISPAAGGPRRIERRHARFEARAHRPPNSRRALTQCSEASPGQLRQFR